MPDRRARAAKYSLLLFLAFAAGCTPMAPAASSNAILIPERTWVIVAKPAQPAAVDVTRLFQQRGFALVDLQVNERGITLRFKGERKVVAEQLVTGLDVLVATTNALEAYDAAKDQRPANFIDKEPTIETYELGSVYYVRVEPRGTTMTSIAMVGRPTRNGMEACTADPELHAPCAPLESGPRVHAEIAGFVEAETINAVFAELRLEGSVVAPDVQYAEAQHRCWTRRREVIAAVQRVSDPRAKAGIMRTAPVCEPTLAKR
jgi:hypothetical protein